MKASCFKLICFFLSLCMTPHVTPNSQKDLWWGLVLRQRQTLARWLLIGQPARVVLCFQILALLLTHYPNTLSDKIPAQMGHRNSSPGMTFEKLSGSFKKLSSKCSYHCYSCQRQSIKIEYFFRGEGGVFKWIPTHLRVSSQRKLIKNKYLEEN